MIRIFKFSHHAHYLQSGGFGDAQSRVLLALTHRRSLKPADLPTILGQIEKMDLVMDERPPPVRHLVDLGRRFALGAYDASYLELALRLHLPLAARDGPLRNAASRAGLLLT